MVERGEMGKERKRSPEDADRSESQIIPTDTAFRHSTQPKIG
jgi:hypothetical protein